MHRYSTINYVRLLVLALVVVVAACGVDSSGRPSLEGERMSPRATEASQKTPNSLRAAYIASIQREASDAYAGTAADGLVHLDNPQQQFVTTIDPQGFVVKPNGDAWQLAMHTTMIGCADSLAPITMAAPAVNGNRVEIRRDGLDEWYMNGPLGIEQGFVLHKAPSCTGPKNIVLALNGNLAPRLEDPDGDGRGQSIRLANDSGRTILGYSDLYVTDALGNEVPAWFSVNGDNIAVVIDDKDATYPLAIDPLIWFQQAKLTANDGMASDYFGDSVAISADTAIVGAPRAKIGANPNQGSAYVFVRNGKAWTLQQKLFATDGMDSDQFGNSVAISGDTAIVGAYFDAIGANGTQGSAYVFVRNGGAWSQQQKLFAANGAAQDYFGNAVAISGDTVIVGATGGGVSPVGRAYVFVRNSGVWTQQQQLTANGTSAALSGDTAIVGAALAGGQGAAHVYVRNGTVWTQQQDLTTSDAMAMDSFGTSVAVSGNTAIVGASHDYIVANQQGSAYVFVRNGTVWSQQQKLVAMDGKDTARFGSSVAIVGDTTIIGAVLDHVSVDYQGSAYVYVRNGTTWTQQYKLTAGDGVDDRFGYSVGFSGTTAIVGSIYDDIGANADQGSAYIFVLDLTNGKACTAGADCTSGFCVDGVCCDSACGDGNPGDCQACSMGAGAAVDGLCGPAAMGTTCRASAGVCDIDETCDGIANDCPADVNASDGSPCMDGICSKGVCMGQGGAGGGSSSSSSSSGSAGSGGSDSASSSSGSGGGGNPSEDGGCACRTGSSSSSAFAAPFSLLGIALLFARRRSQTARR